MYFILFVLDDADKLEVLLDSWQEAGVTGATVIPSTGLGRIRQFNGYRDDLPLMPGLDDFYEMKGNLHRTLFTVAEDEAMVEQIASATQCVVGDLNQPGTGFMVVLPVAKTYGFSKKLGNSD